LACNNITKQHDYTFVHLTLILLPHYLVKYRSRSLAVYNDEFILGSAYWVTKTLWDHKTIKNLLHI